MWTEFSEKSQKTLNRLVQVSLREGRIVQTLERIDGLVERLQTDTPGELKLQKLFGINAERKQSLSHANYTPLSFLYDGALSTGIHPQ